MTLLLSFLMWLYQDIPKTDQFIADSLIAEKRYEQAIEKLEEVAKLCKVEGANDCVAAAYHKIGHTYMRIGSDTLALDFLFQALRIREQLDDLNALASTKFRIGVFYAERHDTSAATEYFMEALDLYRKTGNKLWIVLVEFSLGNVAFESGEFEEAIRVYKESLSSENIASYPEYKALMFNNLANAQKELKQYNVSLSNYERAVIEYKNSGDKNGLMGTYYNIGHLNNLQEQWNDAIPFLMESLILSNELKSIKSERRTLYELSQSYFQTQQMEKAYYAYLRYDSLDQKISGSEVEAQIAELQTKYETESEAKQAKIERNNALYSSLALVVVTAVVIGFYIQRNRRMRLVSERNLERHNNEIAQLISNHESSAFDAMIEGQEKERKRIAEELHDRLGSTLSAAKMHLEASYNDQNGQQQDFVSKLIDKAVEDTREISHNLLSGILTKFGLVAALKDLKETINTSNQLDFSLKTIQLDQRLEMEKEINLYRIIQELLSNTLRHAQATTFQVILEKRKDSLVIDVKDNGNGIARDSGGIGFKNIRARINKMEGDWEMAFRPGYGAHSTLTIPI